VPTTAEKCQLKPKVTVSQPKTGPVSADTSLEHEYDSRMGNTRPEREAPLARTAYVAAARRYVQALGAFFAQGVPLDPGAPTRVRNWTTSDVAVLRELHAALGDVLSTRRRWDELRRRNGSSADR
jgi:hypothetical protein